MPRVVSGVAALALVAVGCVTPDREVVGVTAPHASMTTIPPNREATASAAGDLPDAGLTRIAGPFLSRGHGEMFDVVLWSNEDAGLSPDAGSEAREGALLAEELVSHETPPRSAGWLTMKKLQGGWRFGARTTSGSAADDERTASCASCHRDAKDFVFPLPVR